jgi:hypothetical protein
MSTRTDGKIRPIVWLLGLTPFVVMAAVGVYLLTPGKPQAVQHATAAPTDSVEPPTPVAVASALPSAQLPIAIASTLAALPSAAPAGSGDDRRDIDALLVRPPGSEQWTVEQKNAYRAQLSQDLRRRERDLQWEIAAAHRSGDKAKEQSKTETLDYVRRMREVLEAPLTAPSAAPPPADSAPTGAE